MREADEPSVAPRLPLCVPGRLVVPLTMRTKEQNRVKLGVSSGHVTFEVSVRDPGGDVVDR